MHGSKNIASTTTVDKYFETKLKKVVTKDPIGDDIYWYDIDVIVV